MQFNGERMPSWRISIRLDSLLGYEKMIPVICAEEFAPHERLAFKRFVSLGISADAGMDTDTNISSAQRASEITQRADRFDIEL